VGSGGACSRCRRSSLAERSDLVARSLDSLSEQLKRRNSVESNEALHRHDARRNGVIMVSNRKTGAA
jgi:hypothetical protein